MHGLTFFETSLSFTLEVSTLVMEVEEPDIPYNMTYLEIYDPVSYNIYSIHRMVDLSREYFFPQENSYNILVSTKLTITKRKVYPKLHGIITHTPVLKTGTI